MDDEDMQQRLLRLRSKAVCHELEIIMAISRSDHVDVDGGGREETPTTRLRKLQSELEAVLFEQAGLEEKERIQSIVEKAVNSKRVETPRAIRTVGECGLCLDEMKDISCLRENEFGRFWCCGAACCYECFQKYQKDFEDTAEDITNRFLPNQADIVTRAKTLRRKGLCPFCSCEYRSTQGIYSMKLLRHAKAGKSWAQLEVGHCFRYGRGVTVDLCASAKWYKLAANQGCILATSCFGECLEDGVEEMGVAGSIEHGKPDVLLVARRGLHAAQYKMAVTTDGEQGKEQETLMWIALAAAQYYVPAQRSMGLACMEGTHGVRQSNYAAIYWLRKSATSAGLDSADILAECLLCAKTELFGASNLVGFSAIPEATFWSRLGSEDSNCTGSMNRTVDSTLEYCACCGKKASFELQMKRCYQCQAVGYCGQECQLRHWKLGHKTDCKAVDEFRVAVEKMMKLPSPLLRKYDD